MAYKKQTSGPMKAEFQAVLQAASGDDLQDNQIRVIASTTGNPDAYGRVIFPGAFKPVTKQFVSDGVMLIGHEWSELPIGMILAAAEAGKELQVDAQFHTTQTAQDARTVCQERMAKAKKVPVSIGWYPDYENGVAWFESGQALLDFAKQRGDDMSLFDTKAIKGLTYCMAIWAIEQLVEFSIVCCGANPTAGATQVAGMTFDEQFEEALGAFDSLIARWGEIADKREQLGDSHREKLLELVARLEPIAAKAPEPSLGDDVPDETDHEGRFADLQFRLLAHKTQLKAS